MRYEIPQEDYFHFFAIKKDFLAEMAFSPSFKKHVKIEDRRCYAQSKAKAKPQRPESMWLTMGTLSGVWCLWSQGKGRER